jgi:endonuclease/exonuclease/phosphatase family metal-dependent hydrolase
MVSLRRWTRAVASLALLVLSVAVACAPTPPGPLPGDGGTTALRVMTYNVLGAQADHRLFDEYAGWAARITQLQPDVVVLQEAQSADVFGLRLKLRGTYVRAIHTRWACDAKPDAEGVAILVRADHAVEGTGGTNIGSSCAHPSMRRVLAWADLTVDGHAVRVYGTHLSAGSGAAAASRAAQIEAVRERIGTEIARGERRIVLAGDMNVAPDGSEYPHLVGSVASPPLLSDAFAAVHPHAADAARCPSIATTDAAGLAALWADPSLAADCGYSAGWPKDDNFLGCDVASWCVSWLDRAAASPSERIDYVLIGPGVGVAAARVPSRADADWASPGAEWFRLSDHLPVVADLSLGG